MRESKREFWKFNIVTNSCSGRIFIYFNSRFFFNHFLTTKFEDNVVSILLYLHHRVSTMSALSIIPIKLRLDNKNCWLILLKHKAIKSVVIICCYYLPLMKTKEKFKIIFCDVYATLFYVSYYWIIFTSFQF